MPGITEFCAGNSHAECHAQDCRCQCHPWMQKALLERQQGMKLALVPETETPQAYMLCPQCNARWRPTDKFCRKDGTYLTMGKACLECGAVGEPTDNWCWNCGTKSGERKRPTPIPEETPQRDPLQVALEKVHAMTKPGGVVEVS